MRNVSEYMLVVALCLVDIVSLVSTVHHYNIAQLIITPHLTTV